MNVYFDNAASTKIDPRVLAVMRPYLTTKYGNASSLHRWGQQARQAVETAREIVAQLLSADPEEIIFTGSSTEALNLAIQGASLYFLDEKPKLLTSPIEHHAGLDPFSLLASRGFQTLVIPVNQEGVVDLDFIRHRLDSQTALLNVMYANNEVGTIEPIAELAGLAKAKGVVFHTDASAAKYLPLNVRRLGVDLMTLAPHKFYGPKGIGILYIKKNTKVRPVIRGGHHEQGLRPGTENVAYIVGAAKALELLEENKKTEILRLRKIQSKLISGVLAKISHSRLTGHPKKRVPDVASFLVSGVEGEAMVLRLDNKGIAVSSGSACTSGDLKPSHVLRAMGFKPEDCHGSLRLSLGKYNTLKEADYFLEVFPKIVGDLRQMAPNNLKSS
jgi:cysteine desulfurase